MTQTESHSGQNEGFKSLFIWEDEDEDHVGVTGHRRRSVSVWLCWLLVGMLVVFGGYSWLSGRPITYGPGMVAPHEPLQGPPRRTAFEHEGYEISPVASIQIEARVLGAEHYFLDRESDLSPIDLALGWGRMSDESILQHIRISQASRRYSWQAGAMPIPRNEVETCSANMHLIPSTELMAERFGDVREGHVVQITGQLVNVRGNDGWLWTTSRSRHDTGDGACELIWVEKFEILPDVHPQ